MEPFGFSIERRRTISNFWLDAMTALETSEPKTTKKVANSMFSANCDLNKINGSFHFIGIGGIGMSALARLLLHEGKSVSGSDKQGNPVTDELASLGAKIFIGHKTDNAVNAGAIVVSTAIANDNPEIAWARENDRPIFHRSQILAAIAKGKKVVAVSGTHGKTTTTAMVGKVLIDGGLDPGIVLGGIFPLLKSNCRTGNSQYFVAEADESDGSHTTLAADIAVVTNVEADHMENYAHDIKQIFAAMTKFANQAKQVVLCLDDPGCLTILPELKNKVIGYGKKGKTQTQTTPIYLFEETTGSTIKIYKNNEELGTITLAVPGMHNKYNATAAVAVGIELGIDFKTIAKSLEAFASVDRRFQIIGKENDILIVDDYAHHPTEVMAVLEAAKQYVAEGKYKAKRIVAIFQPHQPGRLQDLWNEFCQAFANCDLLLATDVYIARGGAIPGIDSKRFSKEVKHENCVYLSGPAAQLPDQIIDILKPGDLAITIGAGDITNVGPALVKLLKHGRAK